MAPQPPPPPAAAPATGQRSGVKCPRCESNNTKFCYYNNYSLTQPRHFCKTCRRYWTQGGSLRNIPLGGASRKIKKPSSSSSSSAAVGVDHLAGISPAVDFQVAGSGFYPTNLSPFGDHSGGGGPILDLLRDFHFDYDNHHRIALPLLYGGGEVENRDKNYQKGGVVGPTDVMNSVLLSGDQEAEEIPNPQHSYHDDDHDQHPYHDAGVENEEYEQISTPSASASAPAPPQWIFGGGQGGGNHG